MYTALHWRNSYKNASVVNAERRVGCVLFLLMSHKYNRLSPITVAVTPSRWMDLPPAVRLRAEEARTVAPTFKKFYVAF
jgi:hypothetical protein